MRWSRASAPTPTSTTELGDQAGAARGQHQRVEHDAGHERRRHEDLLALVDVDPVEREHADRHHDRHRRPPGTWRRCSGTGTVRSRAPAPARRSVCPWNGRSRAAKGPPPISNAMSSAATAAPSARPVSVRQTRRRESSRSDAARNSVTPPRLRSANLIAAPRSSGANSPDSTSTSDQAATARYDSGSVRHQARTPPGPLHGSAPRAASSASRARRHPEAHGGVEKDLDAGQLQRAQRRHRLHQLERQCRREHDQRRLGEPPKRKNRSTLAIHRRRQSSSVVKATKRESRFGVDFRAFRAFPMSRILFAHGHLLRFDSKQFAIGKPYPPLATITAAAYLRSLGHDVALYDPTLDEDTRGFAAALERAQPQVLVLYDDVFNWFTKMCLSRMREAALEMIQTGPRRGRARRGVGPRRRRRAAGVFEGRRRVRRRRRG